MTRLVSCPTEVAWLALGGCIAYTLVSLGGFPVFWFAGLMLESSSVFSVGAMGGIPPVLLALVPGVSVVQFRHELLPASFGKGVSPLQKPRLERGGRASHVG